MATVTQQIPNYILGISDQPDELKLNGQVKDLQNAYPDITLGCTKRAGSRLINKISAPAAGQTSWFNIYNDEENQYICNVDQTGKITVFRSYDGVEIPVDYSGTTGTNKADYLLSLIHI